MLFKPFSIVLLHLCSSPPLEVHINDIGSRPITIHIFHPEIHLRNFENYVFYAILFRYHPIPHLLTGVLGSHLNGIGCITIYFSDPEQRGLVTNTVLFDYFYVSSSLLYIQKYWVHKNCIGSITTQICHPEVHMNNLEKYRFDASIGSFYYVYMPAPSLAMFRLNLNIEFHHSSQLPRIYGFNTKALDFVACHPVPIPMGRT